MKSHTKLSLLVFSSIFSRLIKINFLVIILILSISCNSTKNKNDEIKNSENTAGQIEEVLKRDGIIPDRDKQVSPNLIDLSNYYTASLDDDWLVTAGANLQPLPKGIQTFTGVEFDVRGLIQLAGLNLYKESELDESGKKEHYPNAVENIKIQLKGQKIHFLHSTSWSANENEKIGEYVVHYENGEIKHIPINYLQSLRDWFTAPNDPLPINADIAWKGQNETTKKLGLNILIFKYTWENPLSNIEISAIDFVSSITTASPYLIAITIE